MRYITLILLTILISGCGLFNKNLSDKVDETHSNVNGDTDTTINITQSPPIVEEYRDVDVYVDNYVDNNPSDDRNTTTTTTTTTSNNNTIKSFTREIKPNISFPIGHMAYSIPDTMRVGEFHSISLIISKDTSKSQINHMVTDLDGKTRISSTIILNKVRVSSLMSAKLIDIGGNFIIKEISSSEQNVGDYGQTEWNWEVSPRKSGIKSLKLIISVKVENEFGISSQDIPVFRERIFIESNFKWTFKTFFKSYWQWLISTLIIPLLIYLWKRKKRQD